MTDTTSSGSLWLAQAGSGVAYPSLEADAEVEADVAVIGGGIAGATLALRLQTDGARVVLVEAARVGSGVTGCTTAKVSALQGAILSQIASRHGADAIADYASASQVAVEDVAELAATHAIDCDLQRRPAVTYTTDPAQLDSLGREFELAREAGLPVRWEDRDAGLAFDVAGAIWLEDQIGFQPVRYVRGLIAAFVRLGGRVYENTRVLSVHDGHPLELRTAAGRVRAEQVAVCTHFPILDRGLAFARMEAQRSYCVALALTEPETRPRAMAMGLGEADRSVQWFGDDLIVGGEGHPAGAQPQVAAPERFHRLAGWGSARWSTGEVRARWSAQDPVPADRLPLIGPMLPGAKRLWTATGWAKWGLSSGTFAARILADRIGGRDEDGWDGRFSPNRLPLRSLPEIAKLGASFNLHMALDRAAPAQVSAPSGVPEGEARVLRNGPSKLGAYRGADGLRVVSLRCTHLGCLLRFNAAETSWDCPCHGSRFGVDGEVLEGPAVQPLRRYDIV